MTVAVASTCTACGVCLSTCPTGALAPAPRRPYVADHACIDCLGCVEVCPVDAIRWVRPSRAPARPPR